MAFLDFRVSDIKMHHSAEAPAKSAQKAHNPHCHLLDRALMALLTRRFIMITFKKYHKQTKITIFKEVELYVISMIHNPDKICQAVEVKEARISKGPGMGS